MKDSKMEFDNEIKISGHVRQYKMITTESGFKVLNFILEQPRNQKKTDKIDCTIYGEKADELIAEVNEGDVIQVKGRLQKDNWLNQRTSVWTNKTYVNVKTYIIILRVTSEEIEEEDTGYTTIIESMDDNGKKTYVEPQDDEMSFPF